MPVLLPEHESCGIHKTTFNFYNGVAPIPGCDGGMGQKGTYGGHEAQSMRGHPDPEVIHIYPYIKIIKSDADIRRTPTPTQSCQVRPPHTSALLTGCSRSPPWHPAQ
ncbi:hypothetical protein J0S82_020668 [Galemys pyrenaicus]|uniref:Uncharacterized protein n=1 Tax=Galemys pyrenaicus TaxID=202257 RepID=A0A8J6DWR7_GALPY|nr:hypothetical protein J0S82_020668 [Galemys pyrenaicus]